MKGMSHLSAVLAMSGLIGLIYATEAKSQAFDVNSGGVAIAATSPVQYCCPGGQPLLFSQPMVVLTGVSTPELPHLRVLANGVLYFAGPSVKLSVSPNSNLADINVSGGSGLVAAPILYNHHR